MKKIIPLLTVLFLTTQIIYAQVPQGDRILSYTVVSAENQEFGDAFQYASNNCLEIIHQQYVWGQFEESDGSYNPDKIELLDITDIFFPLFNTPLELNIGTVNTNINDIPADLISVPYDNPILIDRFKSFLDTVFAHIPNTEIELLTIGNEGDIVLGENVASYNAYKTFLNAVVPYAKEKYFELHGEVLKVGTTLTHSGLLDAVKGPLCQILNQDLDVVSVTYYPLAAGFQMQSPDVVNGDFDDLVAAYPNVDQPIYFVECGYASSAVCGSSEELQAAFFHQVFISWDEHYDNIKSISLFNLTDWSQATVDQLGAYYNITDEAFLEYLRTLGLRTHADLGEDKLAMQTVQCELTARGWCDEVVCSVGLVELENSMDWLVFPNPSNGTINIKTEQDISPKNIKLLDITGK